MQKEIYQVTMDAHQAAIGSLGFKVPLKNAHIAACTTIFDGQPKSTQFGLKSLRLAKPMQAGHVFTIEPGIYFIPELIDLWRAQNKFTDFINWNKVDSYRNFGGIRNEKDFVMTENGGELLGKPKPKTIEEIEDICAKK